VRFRLLHNVLRFSIFVLPIWRVSHSPCFGLIWSFVLFVYGYFPQFIALYILGYSLTRRYEPDARHEDNDCFVFLAICLFGLVFTLFFFSGSM